MKTLWKIFWFVIWEVSEGSGFTLGIFAPWVFAQMTGLKGVNVNYEPE